MKIRFENVARMTIQAFAEEHDLTMVVSERPSPTSPDARYYARFDSCDVMERGCLVGTLGNGATQEEAISAYADEISRKQLAICAWTAERKNIWAPSLTYAPETK